MTTQQLNVGSGIYTISWKNSHDTSGGYYDIRMEGRAVRLVCVKYVASTPFVVLHELQWLQSGELYKGTGNLW
jgi:hypothetical protein